MKILYRAILNREADEGGLATWTGLLAGGTSRQAVLDGFVLSTEFANLCDSYGIVAIFTQEDYVRNFVARMYTVALDRPADEVGLADWAGLLISRQIDGATVANGFINSDEFKARGLSDETYIRTLYLTLLDRPADEEGLQTWLGLFEQGVARELLLSTFMDSDEFRALCESYGIIAKQTA